MLARIYGIKNCDTMKKAFRWLDKHDIPYEFYDYKKSEIDITVIQRALKLHGWEKVLNRRGTTWRALTEAVKNAMNETNALKAAQENPSLIRRPLLAYNDNVYLGFDETVYKAIFK